MLTVETRSRGSRRTDGRRPYRVLLVEDNDRDAELAALAIQQGGDGFDVSRVADGVRALEFLRARGADGAPSVDLVLLDLNLPRMNGLEVLRRMAAAGDLDGCAVVVLTTSDTRSDALSSYEAGCNCFVTKPLSPDQFMTTVSEVVRLFQRLQGRD